MKLICIILFWVAANTAMAQDAVQLNGNILNLDGHHLVVGFKRSGRKVIESVYPQNGRFEVKLNISEPQEIEIRPYRFTKNAIRDSVRKFNYIPPLLNVFVAPGDLVEINGDAMVLWKAELNGGKYEKDFALFRSLNDPLLDKADNLMRAEYELIKAGDNPGLESNRQEQSLLQSEKKAVLKKFYSENTNSLFALYKFSQNIKSLQTAEAERIFALYPPHLQLSNVGRQISATIEKNKNAGPGATMADFAGRTLKGDTLDTRNLRGKYVLLDFWGSWCKPCRKSNPHLKQLYAQYKDKGFEIVGIAHEIMPTIEKSLVSLKNAVETDGLPWPQLLNNEMAEEMDIVKAYNVGGFPTKILIDKKGVILWRGVGLSDNGLDEQLAAIFGK